MIRRPPRRAAATPVTDLALLLMLGLVLALAAWMSRAGYLTEPSGIIQGARYAGR